MRIFNTKVTVAVATLSVLIPTTQASKDFDGVYLGLGGGGDFSNAQITTSGSAPGGFSVYSDNDLSSTGILGSGWAGYGKMISSVYLGGEVGGEFYTSSGTSTSFFGSNSVKKTNSFSVAARIGKQMIGNILIYAKGGAAFPNYRINSAINARNISVSQNKRIAQIIAGVGAEMYLGKVLANVGVRVGAEYEHTFKQSFNVSLNSGSFSGNTTYKPSGNSLKARISLVF